VGAIYALRAVRNICTARWQSDGLACGCRRASGAKLPFALLLVCLLTFGVYPQMLTAKVGAGRGESFGKAKKSNPAADWKERPVADGSEKKK